MKKIIWSLIAVIILGGLWFVTSIKSGQKQEVIKIGVIGPFTGGLSQYGEAYKNGIVLAEQELNTKAKNFEFIFEDSAYDPAKAVSAFQKLTQIDHVNLVMDWGAATGYGIAPLVEGAKIPFIAFSVDPDVVKPSRYIIRHFYSPDDFASTLWTYFRSKGNKNIAIVKLKLLYYDKITQSLEKLKKTDETVKVIDEYQSFGDKDFRTSISKMISGHQQIDALGVFLGGGQIAQFYKQAKVLKLTTPTFGADFFESQTEIDNADGLMNEAIYVNIGVTDDFKEKYKAKYGNENQVSFAGQSYDFVNILVNNVDFSSSQNILSSFEKIRDFKGILGKYTYSNEKGDRYLKSDLYIKKIDNGKITIIK